MSTTGMPTGKLGFGEFTLDLERGALLGPLGEIKLRPKSYQVLCYLVEHAGRLVSKDELFDAVWGQTVVTEDSLTQCLVEIRRALGDGATCSRRRSGCSTPSSLPFRASRRSRCRTQHLA